MRIAIVGLIGLLLAGVAFAQVDPIKSGVEAVGFDGLYRPCCWTPLRVKLVPSTGTSEEYKIVVEQEDLDRDKVIFSQRISLSGNQEGQGPKEQRFWMYFIPQPTGLSEPLSDLKVFLCDKNNNHLQKLPITVAPSSIISLDDASLNGPRTQGTKLVLMVSDPRSQPRWDVFNNAVGMLENVLFHRVRPMDLPEHMIGYEAVDAVIWFNADPAELSSSARDALQDYVREGGKLIVCQDREWQKIAAGLGDMLPVTVSDVREVKADLGLSVLRKMGKLGDREMQSLLLSPMGTITDPWQDLAGRTFPLAVADPKPGAVVAEWADAATPYLVRGPYGMGCVSWVAQDLGDPAFRSSRQLGWFGWADIWDRVFDWRNDPVTEDMANLDRSNNKAIANRYKDYRERTTRLVDLSRTLSTRMDLTSKSTMYVGLAMLFFVLYWILAGPGMFFYLAKRKRTGMNWFGFAVCSLAATGLTVALVNLLLRGAPEVRHLSIVRVEPDRQAVIHSEFGLYIPRDNPQKLAITGTAARRASYLTAYPKHPDLVRAEGGASGFTGVLDYEVPVRDPQADVPVEISVPYRRTLKKFQAKWIGQLDGRITGTPAVSGSSMSGELVNATGVNLHNVYLLAKGDMSDYDVLLYVPDPGQGAAAWPKGRKLDLSAVTKVLSLNNPSSREPSRALIPGGWTDLWYGAYRRGMGMVAEVNENDLTRSILLLSLFDRLPPVQAMANPNMGKDRFELLRRSGRPLDISAAISSGRLVILAQGDPNQPLPFPLEVEGQQVQGQGDTFYQFILPLQRPQAQTRPALPAEQEPGNSN